MFDRIAPRYDRLNRIMTFGMDAGWRRKSIATLGLDGGSTVVDVACGTGDFCRELQNAGLDPIGFDVSFGMLSMASTHAPLVQGDGLRLPLRDAAADGLTCGFALRNVVDLRILFEESARVLRPGGRAAFLETAQPDNPVLSLGHRLYFHKVVPKIGGWLSDRDAYSYLPKSSAYLPPKAGLIALLQDAGFGDVSVHFFGLGAVQLLTGTRS
ncbi:MAG: ubiquinone/menaquinone biosynthesis methyltransferase [Actinobacteria bacterium]|nr:ubiquinone/menaquinone biosynthesis methyltransferase [Actinomycetota bacterium]